MKKSTLIANCLVQQGIVRPLATAEMVVKQEYEELNPSVDFDTWNQEIVEDEAEELLAALAQTRLNVEGYMKHLDSVIAPPKKGK